jgi:hypothetical protein
VFFVYFLNVMVYLFKVIYEMSLDLRGVVHFGSALSQIVQTLSLIMTCVVISLHSELRKYDANDKDYYNFAEVATIHSWELFYYSVS